jgi:hypothetical protein
MKKIPEHKAPKQDKDFTEIISGSLCLLADAFDLCSLFKPGLDKTLLYVTGAYGSIASRSFLITI